MNIFEKVIKAVPKQIEVRPGFPIDVPYGANISSDGVHFTLFSRNATKVWLLLFENPEDAFPEHEIELDPGIHRTGDIWHVWVRGLRDGQLYLYRIDGPYDKKAGFRFDPDIFILDPYARALTGEFKWDELDDGTFKEPLAVRRSTSGAASDMPKCVVCSDRFEWDGDRPLSHPMSDTVIYECHVRGLTAHPSANVKHPGTYAGLIEMIPYFKDLGVTTLELLPVAEFSAIREYRFHPKTKERLDNYWGYNTINFFAPNGRYSSSGTRGEQVSEFKEMVKACHKAGLEVILDVVFNHTAEGDDSGSVFSFKGIDNKIYYMLDSKDGSYQNFTGCGNTMNCNHPVVRRFIIECLHYWVLHMHVDGFRFDLASVLGRDEKGELMPNPPLLRTIDEDPVLRNTKIIAEAWDAAGAYQVGKFSGRWAEWNGRFRDDIRRFWRGDTGATGAFATRISGSSDLYGDDGRSPLHSINFVVSHDGFTLNDWTSYDKKHNEDNAHGNADGDNHNLSYNHGVEGPSDDPAIRQLRLRQSKNMFATLFLSLGTPMMLGGGEMGRTQMGNNNAYCQDNEISWFDWTFKEKNKEIFRFVNMIIDFRRAHPSIRRPHFYTGQINADTFSPDIIWYGANGNHPDWNGTDLSLAILINGHYATDRAHMDDDIFIMFNANDKPSYFIVPDAPNGGKWRLAVDTGKPAPNDIYPPGTESLVKGEGRFRLLDKSLVVLIADCAHH